MNVTFSARKHTFKMSETFTTRVLLLFSLLMVLYAVNRPPHLDPNRKKKTATQLRRERKKRQLERERRQRGSSERAEKSQESRKPSIASSMHDDSGIATSESASGQEESLQKKPHPEEPPTSSSTSSSSTPKPTHHKKIKPVVIIHKHSSQHNRTSTAAHSPCEHITKKGGVASGGAADPETGQKLPPLKDKERNGRPKKHKSSENPDTSRNGTQEDLLPASKANLKATPMGNAHKLSQKIGPGIKLLKKPSFRSKLINSAINFPKCPPPSPSSPITSSPASKKTPTTTANHSKK